MDFGFVWVVFGVDLVCERCRQGLLFIAPADAARHKRCLWSVSRVR
ncbi:hypothetical protein ACU6KR_004838, partial [Escherichia coli]